MFSGKHVPLQVLEQVAVHASIVQTPAKDTDGMFATINVPKTGNVAFAAFLKNSRLV